MSSKVDNPVGERSKSDINLGVGKYSLVNNIFFDIYEHEGVWLSAKCPLDEISAIKAMDMRADDIILATYPRCGTHWMAEIVLLLLHGGRPLTGKERFGRMVGPLEIKASRVPFGDAFPYEDLAEMASPRLIYTHLPVHLLPDQVWEKKPRVICVSRNPRDVLASSFHFIGDDPDPPSFDELFERFLSGKISCGSCWAHQYAYWKHRHDDNFLWLRFRDMKEDPAGCISKVASHLSCDLTAEQMQNAIKYSTMPEMKATYARFQEEFGSRGRFLSHAGGLLPILHKGTIGGWKDLFSQAQSERFQRHHEEQVKKYEIDIWE